MFPFGDKASVYGGLVQGGTAGDSEAELLAELASALLALPPMSTPDSRAIFARHLAVAADGLPDIRHSAQARTHVMEIIHTCRDHPHGLTALAMTARAFAPSHPATAAVADLTRALTIRHVVTPADRTKVAGILERTGHLDLPTLWYAAADELALLPTQPPQSAIDTFDQLSHVNARSDGLPPALAFIEYVAARANPEVAAELRQWNDEQASRLGLAAELGALRMTAVADPPLTVAPPCLVVQLAEHGIDSGRYILSHWVQHRPGRWNPERGDDQTVTLDTVHGAVENLLLRAETIWNTRPGPASLEFVLPTPLLNESVDWWPTSPSAPDAVPLCIDYPVVIRSLERMRNLHYHRLWRNRWEQLLTASSIRAFWALAEEDDIAQWNARLRADVTFTAVVLGAAPLPSPTSRVVRLSMALRAGVPVILWDRRERRAENFREVVDTIVSGRPMSMEDRVRELRSAAAVADGMKGANHPGRHLAVLWDDPDRLVDTPLFAHFDANGRASTTTAGCYQVRRGCVI